MSIPPCDILCQKDLRFVACQNASVSWPKGEPPRDGNVDDRAKEEEEDELEQATFHGAGPSRLTSITNDVSVARTTIVPLITVL